MSRSLLALLLAAAPAAALAAEGGGLPQLDASRFAPQIVWLAISFVALYLLVSRVALPRVTETLDERERRISSDLEKATALRDEAEAVKAQYEKALAEARDKAHGLLMDAQAAMAKEIAAREAELGERLAKQTREAEARIGEAKAAALGNLKSVAVEVAAAATAKLAGSEPGGEAVGRAVDAALEGRA